jgi:NADH:ubiquinone oxidoreductase subunit
VPGTWALEDKFDASMVHPDWHGWIHYMHDIPGDRVSRDFSKPFKQHHRINQTMLRPYYTTPANTTSKHFVEGQPPAHHTPPGALDNKRPRGRLGPKFQPWRPGAPVQNELRNYADNTKILDMP